MHLGGNLADMKKQRKTCVFLLFLRAGDVILDTKMTHWSSLGNSGLLLGALVGWDAEKLVFYDVLRA